LRATPFARFVTSSRAISSFRHASGDKASCSRGARCRIFRIDAALISDHVEFDPALAIKFTIYRRMPTGSSGDAVVFGSQQYGPLLDIEVPGMP
jgi:hypothetical protein